MVIILMYIIANITNENTEETLKYIVCGVILEILNFCIIVFFVDYITNK